MATLAFCVWGRGDLANAVFLGRVSGHECACMQFLALRMFCLGQRIGRRCTVVGDVGTERVEEERGM